MSQQTKHYYTISEVAELLSVKQHVLRYWEKEFSTLQPSTRSGKRRYYQKRDIDHIKRIKHLLYDKGFTIQGAKAQLEGGAVMPKRRTADVKQSSGTAQQKAEIMKELQLISDLLD